LKDIAKTLLKIDVNIKFKKSKLEHHTLDK